MYVYDVFMRNADNITRRYNDYDHAEKQQNGYDFTIDYNGNWYYHSGALAGPIKRDRLAALFGGAGSGFMAGKGLLRDESGQYWLRSPDGQYGVDVEDVPFLVTGLSIEKFGSAEQSIKVTTNFDETVVLGRDHPVFMRAEPQGQQQVLYCVIRKGLEARFSRAVFSELVLKDILTLDEDGHYTLRSSGEIFRFKLDTAEN